MASQRRRSLSFPRVGGPISREETCDDATFERKYYELEKVHIKRSLRPHEYIVRQQDTVLGPAGSVVVPKQSKERLQNDAECLRYIKANTNIPVPTVYCDFEDDKAYYLITEKIPGMGMHHLTKAQRDHVQTELDQYRETLWSLKSNKIGGPTGLVIVPWRIPLLQIPDVSKLRDSKTEDFVFCHGDFRQENVIVDPDTLKVAAIIDWEYGGFFPKFFDRIWYRRLAPKPQPDEEDDFRYAVIYSISSTGGRAQKSLTSRRLIH